MDISETRIRHALHPMPVHNILYHLALLAEAHDPDTAAHNQRVAGLSALIGHAMGLDKDFCEDLLHFAPLHDIGKVFVRSQILNTPGHLSPQERALIRQHPDLGARFLQGPWFRLARNIAACHHERMDGSGYPRGLMGHQIPLEARIVAVADVYDALRSPRPYKPSMDSDEAIWRMRQGDERIAPGSLCPVVLDGLEAVHRYLDTLYPHQIPTHGSHPSHVLQPECP